MRNDRFLVLVKKDYVSKLNNLLNSQALPGWSELFNIKEIGEKKDVRKPTSISPTDTSYDLLQQWNNGEFKQILADKDVAFDRKMLIDANIHFEEGGLASITSKINSELDKRKLHWLSHSKSEWEKSVIRFSNPQAWQQQFSELGYPWIGMALLKQLRLITEEDLRQVFQNHPGDTLGLKVGHAYFKDDEPGSSSTSIKDVLSHLIKENLIECDLNSDKPIGEFYGDILFLYEDGLWSGVELVRRLEKLHNAFSCHYPHTRIHFRFGVSSDAGLLSGRYFLNKNKMVQVTLDTGRMDHINFIEEHARTSINFSNFASYEDFRKSIDKIVVPYAFGDSKLWLGRQEEAKMICRDIGKQLVRPWVERTMPGEDIDKKSEKWALGAFSFASTLAFSKSVPKPVLPLFWLAGNVKIGDQEIMWKPLFWDVRRAGPVPFVPKR